MSLKWNGLLIVNKPSGRTSHDVVKKIKNHFKLGKVGHAGTLDPNATGVLVLCIGSATRFVRFLPCDPKEYEGEMILGIRTDTLDITGQIISEEFCHISLEELKKTFNSFLGYVNQIPPMVSAVKVSGMPLYRLARRGKEIDRKPRKVQIFNLEILKVIENKHQRVLFKVTCAKGTYIRTLCDDVGNYLRCGACLGNLIRTRSGNFTLSNAYKVSDLLKLKSDEFEKILLPLNEVLKQYNSVTVKNNFKSRVLNGGFLSYNMIDYGADVIKKEATIRMLDSEKNFLGLAKAQIEFSAEMPPSSKQVVLKPICILSAQNN